MKLRVLELFGGISAPHKALSNLGINVETVDYVEFDPDVVDIRNSIYNTNYEPQSVVDYFYDNPDDGVDLLIGGSPCQDFSIGGNQAGGDINADTRSSLMWEQLRIIEEVRPKVTIWENVKNVLSKNHIHNFEMYAEYLEEVGYTSHYAVLNSKDFGIPQSRERVFLVSIRNDIEIDFDFGNLVLSPLKNLGDFIDFSKDYDYYYKRDYKTTKNYIQLVNNSGLFTTQSWRIYTEDSPYVGTISTKPNYKVGETFFGDEFHCRYMTTLEAFMLMGFGEDDHAMVEHFKPAKLYHVAGNSIVVDVLEAIFLELYKEEL